MNDLIHLSTLLAARRAEILERWTNRIAREHADKDLSPSELRDHLPLFFDAVLAALADEEGMIPGAAAAAPTGPGAVSENHGTQRLRVGFDLAEVIREYEILTECILDEVEAVGGSVSIGTFRRVQALLNSGRTHAVAAYVERRDEEVAREHSQHVAFIAHELRNALAAALLGVTALRKQNEPAAEEWALNMVTRNLNTLRDLIDQVLLAERLAGKPQLKRESLDLCKLLEQTAADARPAARQRDIELVIEIPDALPFFGDARLLRSAVTNLLGNAVKFTHDGGRIVVRAFRREGLVTVEFEDGCGGLPEGSKTDLFEPFVQRNAQTPGFGLGLAIVKQAIEAHGGRVSVRDLPGHGCVFSLELPDTGNVS